MHPALHVGLGRACVYVSPFPPTSDLGDMFASRGFFVNVIHLLWLRPFAIEDAPAIGPECLCGYVFRVGFTPYDPNLHLSGDRGDISPDPLD